MSFDDFQFGDEPETAVQTYALEAAVRLSARFHQVSSDTELDPATVTVWTKDPSDNVTEYVYGTDPEVVKDSTGNYHADITADEAGTWYYGWRSTGTGQAAKERSFIVAESENP